MRLRLDDMVQMCMWPHIYRSDYCCSSYCYISREAWLMRYVYWSRAYVCLSVPRRIPTVLHGPDFSWGIVGVPSSCALSGRFAIDARVSLLWQHSTQRGMSPSVCGLLAQCMVVNSLVASLNARIGMCEIAVFVDILKVSAKRKHWQKL